MSFGEKAELAEYQEKQPGKFFCQHLLYIDIKF